MKLEFLDITLKKNCCFFEVNESCDQAMQTNGTSKNSSLVCKPYGLAFQSLVQSWCHIKKWRIAFILNISFKYFVFWTAHDSHHTHSPRSPHSSERNKYRLCAKTIQIRCRRKWYAWVYPWIFTPKILKTKSHFSSLIRIGCEKGAGINTSFKNDGNPN